MAVPPSHAARYSRCHFEENELAIGDVPNGRDEPPGVGLKAPVIF
ncbi:hypothetical protein FTUN_4616 [Frigoriglobus tundricola]|uniref:Uncharacterized protein n=1 Tax=Frigoriglobus tundricola TaxID=2774151 RepID=A0A6M5YVX3_9BACT|nr:hypothetical protein FTUN_4616 [Frigoriglobus tundricola]